MSHIPVLLKEVVAGLNLKPDYKLIDCTAGSGGHIQEVLRVNPQTKVLGIDWDQSALAKLKEKFGTSGLGENVSLVHGNYKDIKTLAEEFDFVPADGILIDLGYSSTQIDDPARGFSFQSDGPLDMRFDQKQNVDAQTVLNKYSETKLTQTLKLYGEESFSAQIARAIVRQRQVSAVTSTGQLLALITEALPKSVRHKAHDSARRVFQALRIEVNHELDNLKKFLPDALEILKPNGRLVVISFHSLEDRIVKRYFQEEAKNCVCPPEFPVCICGKSTNVRIITRKPITASEEEIKNNSRSKPAKLRVAEKI